MPSPTLFANFYAGYDQAAPAAAALDLPNPATGETIARAPDSGAEEIAAAVAAATEKLPWWAARTPRQRSLVLLSLAAALEQRAGEFAYALARGQGLPLALAREWELPAAVRNLRYWATSILHEKGEARAEAGGPLAYTITKPLGVAGLILPSARGLSWLTQLAGAALAHGNTVVAKPSRKGSLVARLFADLLNEAGVPPGTLNLVFGTGARTGEALAAAPGLAALAFAGRADLSRELGARAAARGLRFVGEEGGRQINIISQSADLAEAAIAGVRGAFSPLNEAGADASVFLVEKSVFAAFAEKFARAASLVRVGDPEERESQVGPLASAAAAEAFRSFTKGGARLIFAAELPAGKGFYAAPTVLAYESGTLPASPPAGPLACLVPYENEAALLGKIKEGKFQTATLWSKELSAAALAASLPLGSVTINAWHLDDAAHPLGGAKRGALAIADLAAAFSRQQTIRIKM